MFNRKICRYHPSRLIEKRLHPAFSHTEDVQSKAALLILMTYGILSVFGISANYYRSSERGASQRHFLNCNSTGRTPRERTKKKRLFSQIFPSLFKGKFMLFFSS